MQLIVLITITLAVVIVSAKEPVKKKSGDKLPGKRESPYGGYMSPSKVYLPPISSGSQISGHGHGVETYIIASGVGAGGLGGGLHDIGSGYGGGKGFGFGGHSSSGLIGGQSFAGHSFRGYGLPTHQGGLPFSNSYGSGHSFGGDYGKSSFRGSLGGHSLGEPSYAFVGGGHTPSAGSLEGSHSLTSAGIPSGSYGFPLAPAISSYKFVGGSHTPSIFSLEGPHSHSSAGIPSGSYGVPLAPAISSYNPQLTIDSSHDSAGISGEYESPSYAAGHKGLRHYQSRGSYDSGVEGKSLDLVSAGLHGGYASSSSSSGHSQVPFRPSVFLGATHEVSLPAQSYGAPSGTTGHAEATGLNGGHLSGYLPSAAQDNTYFPPSQSYGAPSGSYGTPSYNTINYSAGSSHGHH